MLEQAGPYKLLDRLGGGGFGDVWRARTVDGEEFACKVSKLRRTDPNGFRFLREIRYQSQLLHRGIMPVLDFDLESDYPWFVMPLASGTLEAAKASLTHDQIVHVMSRICEALGFAHKNGMIHRDLKPDNVLLLERPDREWVIADFGLGRAINSSDSSHRTATNVGGGTRGYAAPEQEVDFKNADARADIFACGQILNFLLIGTTLPAGTLPSSDTGDFAYVVRRSTAYAASERYPSIDDFYSDLQLLANGGQDLRSPERQALSILSQGARDRPTRMVAADLMRILSTHSSDQRLYLNVVPRMQASILQAAFDNHGQMSNEVLLKYMSFLAGPLPVDYAEMSARFLADAHQLSPSVEVRTQVAIAILDLAVTANTYELRAISSRILITMTDAPEIAAFVRLYRPSPDAQEWAAQYLAGASLPTALRRALRGVR